MKPELQKTNIESAYSSIKSIIPKYERTAFRINLAVRNEN